MIAITATWSSDRHPEFLPGFKSFKFEVEPNLPVLTKGFNWHSDKSRGRPIQRQVNDTVTQLYIWATGARDLTLAEVTKMYIKKPSFREFDSYKAWRMRLWIVKYDSTNWKKIKLHLHSVFKR